jgi:hypothetical protein
VDDAQWRDAASGLILGFIARRLRAQSVAIMVAVREPSTRHDFDRLPELLLRGLPKEDARALLRTAVPGRLDDRVGDRIIAETRGNPLALLDQPRSMAAAELAGGFKLLPGTDLPRYLEESYLQHAGELPDATQGLLLLAAAEAIGDAALVWRAAHGRFSLSCVDGFPDAQGAGHARRGMPGNGAIERVGAGPEVGPGGRGSAVTDDPATDVDASSLDGDVVPQGRRVVHDERDRAGGGGQLLLRELQLSARIGVDDELPPVSWG